MSQLNKKDIIQLLERIAVYLEIKGENAFRISAYRKAAQSLERDERSIEEIEDPAKLAGIGKGTAGIINDFLETGTTELLQELESEIPEGLLPLLKLPGLGGKKIGKLYQELGVENAETLKAACEAGEVSNLAGFGKKTEEKILAAVNEMGKRPERLPLPEVTRTVEELTAFLQDIKEIDRFELAGSFRRGRETVKDLDFIISTSHPVSVGEKLVTHPNVTAVIGHGETKVSVELTDKETIVPVDFRMVEDESFATMLHHFTGSKDHNVLLRQIAKSRGESISEYGVKNEESGEVTHFDTEADFFHHFDLPWIAPEVREGKEEIDDAAHVKELVSMEDMKGDLHMHTTWSDGAQSIDEMIEACRMKGHAFMAITDHSKFLQVANGLTEERLKRQHEEIRTKRETVDDLHVFTGIEMDILPDGSLDYGDEVLKEIDFVIASIHSSFSQDEETIMKRLEAACRNPHVAMIAHPTGRLIGRRDGYQVNLERLIDLAVQTGTILEINANPNRLDLSAEWAEKAQEKGALISINTDAHRYDMLDHLSYGVRNARRGWIRKETVVNTWSVKQLTDHLWKNRL
ncbi:DNA polymerase/3'-5' exonuclease PolX [Salisediminibacterium selenitireducens]|uniref:DNA polymerase beta n=1 Tax=Bacillus selenitireducens (strain ATCC 700615 / DSM 15326 / MLS10) TaxID=439292 RepID=D6XSW3_BACIE|nr:DNA polymerase/3'-5' exonuclease PolX [Salisediminibacterium selenitireducens]ADH98899.1 PHP domain protein [[Bacillus] selenitireducens MLS10]